MKRLAYLLLLLFLLGCVREVRTIIAEPIEPHDRERDTQYCQQRAAKYGVINLEPTMSGSDLTRFPDERRRAVLYQACMEQKGYQFAPN